MLAYLLYPHSPTPTPCPLGGDSLLELFQHLGFPVLLGTSRKSMIGLTLDLPVDQRVEGTVATSVMGVMKGCAFVRVHDIKENRRAVLMTEAILGRNIK